MRALLILLFLALPVAAEDVEVDVELVLAVDVSRSMSPRELEIQRRGYAEALVSDEVIAAIAKGAHGRIALSYMEWAGTQRVIVDWTLIETRADAARFAGMLTAEFNDALRRTSISGALDFAAQSFSYNGFSSWRQVIDVSGDGPNNQGRPVLDARADVLARGIVINGLPLMTREGLGSQWHLDDLDKYYEACVIGGPGSFNIPVLSWDQFPAAVRLKLIQELASGPPDQTRPRPANFHVMPAPEYDCLIGERIWERFRDNQMLP
ncbi:MAG: DUF1194 domain-containing protein [Pseudomonadota bacterium]